MGCTAIQDLTRSMLDNCKPVGQGLNELLYVAQLNQISGWVPNTANDKIIDSFTLVSGAKIKVWQGRKLSNKSTVGFTEGDAGNKMPHGLVFQVFDNSADADKEIDRISQRSDLVVFVKQNGINGRWKALGFTTGMKMTNLSYDSNDANAPGQYTLDFSAALETETPKQLLHKTSSLDDTESYLQSMALALPSA